MLRIFESNDAFCGQAAFDNHDIAYMIDLYIVERIDCLSDGQTDKYD